MWYTIHHMKTLKEYTQEARDKKIAIGHFNISTLDGLWAIVRASEKLNVPVIIGVSEGERDFIGVKELSLIIKNIRESKNIPIFLNADHTYSYERLVEVVDAGYDSVIIDGSHLSYEENIALTKKSCEYAKSINKDILVEGELGYIGSSSKILDKIPDEVSKSSLTDPIQAKDFIDKTGIELFAPAVGNIHGMLSSGHNPKLDIERIKEISEKAQIPLVLHGGSGISDEDFVSAIDAGICIIHINTELRVAYKKGLMLSLQENQEEIAPYKYLKGAMQAMQKVVEQRLSLFNKLN